MKKKLLIIYVIFSILTLLASLYIYNIGKDYLNVKKNDFLGNTSTIINSLKQKEGRNIFSFGYISDTHNSDSSIWLVKALLKGNIDFLVFVGDFVKKSLLSEHRLFLYSISRLNPKIPIFVVPGNHDIEPERGKKGSNKFYKKDYQELYGPVNFSFIYNNCLFVFICNIDQKDAECTAYLGSVLSKKSPNIKHIFVFCHTPLRKVLNKIFQRPLWAGKLDEMVDKYKVDYVISGDYHKHLEVTDDNKTQHIVSGSGGAHLVKNGLFGRFKNGTKVTVFPDAVMREIVVCDKKIIFTDNSIKRFVYDKFMPELEPRFWMVNTIMVFFIINALFSVYCFIKRIEI